MRLEPCILCVFLTTPPPRLEKHEAWCWWWRWGQWWPWFFSRLGREMVTYLVYPGSTTGSPLFLTHWRGIMGWSSVHGKRRENIKKASGVKGFVVRSFYRQSFCRKTLADLPLVHSCIIFLCCLDGPSYLLIYPLPHTPLDRTSPKTCVQKDWNSVMFQ